MMPGKLILQYARPTSKLEKRDVERCHKLTEVLKRFLWLLATSFVSECQHEPILECYMSDGTPLSCLERYNMEQDDMKVRRAGRKSSEWLAQRLYLVNSSLESRVLFTEPVLLKNKTAWAHYQVQADLWPMCRQLGHEHIVISHHCWDRALLSACFRRQQQRHKAHQMHLESELGEGPAYLLSLKSWQTAVGCFAHDCHNALKWSVLQHVTNRATMRDCWVVLESLGNGFDQLVKGLRRWLPQHVGYCDGDADQLAQLWGLVGLDSKWLDYFVNLQIRWEGGQLLVREDLEDDPETPQMITLALLHAWKFKTWSDSRWCGLGQGCRSLLGAMLLGMPSLVDSIAEDPSQSNYYIEGFKRLRGEVRQMVCMVACSSKVSESVTTKVLDDERVPRNLTAIDSKLAAESGYVLNLPDSALAPIAKLCDRTVFDLQHDNAVAVSVQIGYMQRRLREARKPPWTMCGGSPLEKLQALESGPRPNEEVTQKMYDLLRMGYPKEALVSAVELLGQCPWTTTNAEQAHSAASAVMKSHREYSQSTMTSRAMMVQARPLFAEDHVASKIAACDRRIAHLSARRFASIQGRQAYISSVAAQAREPRTRSFEIKKNIGKVIIKGHSKSWAALSPALKEKFEAKAERLREERREETRKMIAKVKEQRRALTQQRAADSAKCGDKPFRLSSCRFSETRVDEFEDFYQSGEWSHARVAELRGQAGQEVGPPPAPVIATLNMMSVRAEVPAADPPDWLGWMCFHREYFQSAALRVESFGSTGFYKFVFAYQNPHLVCCCRLHPLERVGPEFRPDNQAELSAHLWDHMFAWDWDGMCFTDAGLFLGATKGSVAVLVDAACRSPNLVCADGEWVTLHDLEDILPALPARVRGQEAPAARKSEEDPGIHIEPWMHHEFMWQYMKEGCDEPESPAAKPKPCLPLDESSSSEEDSSADEGTQLDAEEDPLMRLWDRRGELEASRAVARQEGFDYILRGGMWTQQHLGVAYHAYMAFAKAGLPTDFCERYGFTRTASYTISKFGEEACLVMVRAWMHKMSFFYNIWWEHDCSPSFQFEEEHIQAYRGQEPEELTELERNCGAEGVRIRIRQVRNLAPRRL